jgi:tetratricopeptide (TPR) repeat protein
MPEYPVPTDLFADAYDTIFRTLDTVADAHLANGNLDGATQALSVGTQLSGAGISPHQTARRWLRLGNVRALWSFLRNEGFAGAIESLDQAQRYAEAATDPLTEADALAGLGMALHYQRLGTGEGTIEDALAHFEQAQALRETTNDRHGLCESRFQIGLMDQFKGDWDAAHKAFAESYTLAKEHGWHLEQSYAVRHLGFWQLRTDQLDAALAAMQESLTLREAIGQRLLYPFSHLAIGDAHAALGSLPQAADHHRLALTLADEMGLGVPRAFAILSLGEVAEASGDQARALERYREALAAGEQLHLARLQRACRAKIAALTSEQPTEHH